MKGFSWFIPSDSNWFWLHFLVNFSLLSFENVICKSADLFEVPPSERNDLTEIRFDQQKSFRNGGIDFTFIFLFYFLIFVLLLFFDLYLFEKKIFCFIIYFPLIYHFSSLSFFFPLCLISPPTRSSDRCSSNSFPSNCPFLHDTPRIHPPSDPRALFVRPSSVNSSSTELSAGSFFFPS